MSTTPGDTPKGSHAKAGDIIWANDPEKLRLGKNKGGKEVSFTSMGDLVDSPKMPEGMDENTYTQFRSIKQGGYGSAEYSLTETPDLINAHKRQASKDSGSASDPSSDSGAHLAPEAEKPAYVSSSAVDYGSSLVPTNRVDGPNRSRDVASLTRGTADAVIGTAQPPSDMGRKLASNLGVKGMKISSPA